MKRIIFVVLIAGHLISCTTLDQSMRLGAVTGALTGASSVYSSFNRIDQQPTSEEVSSGAVIGLGLGLITSYFIHQKVIEDRNDSLRQTEIYFGDLPPSPFIMPPINLKKGK